MKRRVLRGFILLLLFVFISGPLFAQPKWVNYTTDSFFPNVHIDGDTVWYTSRGGVASIVVNTNETFLYHTANSEMPANEVIYSALAPDGALWVLTSQRLGKFVNGNYVAVNNMFDGDKVLLYSGEMHFDHLGNLVIGARYVDNGSSVYGIFRIAPNEEISLVAGQDLTGNPVFFNFAIDGDNRVWIANQSNEVKVVDLAGNLSIINADNSSMLNQYIINIFHSNAGKVCIIQNEMNGSTIESIHFSIFDGEQWETTSADYDNVNALSSAFYDHEENLWFSVNTGDINKYSNGELSQYPWPLNLPTQGSGTRVLLNVDAQGNWWLFNYNFHKNRLYQYDQQTVTSYSLVAADFAGNRLEDVYVDPGGKVWAISSNGVYEFDGLEWISHIDEMYVSRFYMNNICRDPQGNVWVSAQHDSGEMYTFARYDGEDWEHIYLGTLWETPFVQEIYASEFFFDPDGILWAASNAGVIRYDGEEWTFVEPLNWEITDLLRKLKPKQDGTFYVAGYRELYDYNGADFEEIFLPLEPLGQIYWLFVDQSNNLWIYHTDHLGIYDGSNYVDATDLLPDDIATIGGIFDMTQDLNGVYWFGTCNGLLRYDQENWTYLSEGVVDQCVTDVEVDSLNNIWMATLQDGLAVYNENGINKLSPPIGACVKGETFYDVNENGLQDNGDYTVQNQKVLLLPDSTIKFTSIVGEYRFLVPDSSNVTVEVFPDPDNWVLSTDSASYTIEVQDICIDSLDFGLKTTQTESNATIDLSTSMARCSQTSSFWLWINNTGFLPFSGKYALQLDETVTLISSNPAPVNSDGNTYYWEITDLAPFGVGLITLEIEYPGVEAIGDTISFFATLYDEEGRLHDTDSISQEIRCSYDPNDKSVQPTGPSLGELSLIEDALEYLVRFENTGNDTAFQVVIRDQLSPWLDPGSLELISSSHPVDITIRDHLVEFTFNPIELPYTDINPIGSQGFVKFRVSPVSTIQDNQLIENSALIYFDFNPPILTNTVRNILVEELPVINSTRAVINDSQCQSLITPNPVSDLAWVQVDEAFWHGQFVLYNSIGVKVLERENVSKTFSFQRNDLPAGVYFYHFRKEGEICSGKLLVN